MQDHQVPPAHRASHQDRQGAARGAAAAQERPPTRPSPPTG